MPARERRLNVAGLGLLTIAGTLILLDPFVRWDLYIAAIATALVGGSLQASALRAAARREQDRWDARTYVQIDVAGMASEPGAIVRRVGFPTRVGLIALAVGSLGLAIAGALDENASVAIRVIWPSCLLTAGAFALIFLRPTLVATNSGVAIRHYGRWRSAAWSEIADIEPTDNGFVFTLDDGRTMIATVTSKSRLPFRPVRYDLELLEELRRRVT